MSPSIELQLTLRRKSRGSQDSLLSSGSNQELQTQLDSEIAHVDALTNELMSEQKTDKEDPAAATIASAPPQKPRRVSKETPVQSHEVIMLFMQEIGIFKDFKLATEN